MAVRTSQDERPEAQAGPAQGGAIAPELRIVEWQNEWIVKGAFDFDCRAPDAALAELRQRYRLDEVVASGQTEMEQMTLLREWVHTRWKHGWCRTPPAHRALEILEAAEKGSDFNCGYYAVTLVECLLALGFVARRVSISKAATEWMAEDEGNIGHSVAEVWSHQFRKWMMLDADLNIHYERDGVPLNALEIHRAWVKRRWDEVRVVQGLTPFRLTDREGSGFGVDRNVDDHFATKRVFNRHNVGDYYYRVRVWMQNTVGSDGGSGSAVHWIDADTPPLVIERNRPGTDIWTGNEHDLYWTVDQVQIDLRADGAAWDRGEGVLNVSLAHSMPNLDRLMVRFDTGVWQEAEPEISWRLRPGKNEMMAKGVNAFGREGHISRIHLRYHP